MKPYVGIKLCKNQEKIRRKHYAGQPIKGGGRYDTVKDQLDRAEDEYFRLCRGCGRIPSLCCCTDDK